MQLAFGGKTKGQIAIERIQEFCPSEGYYLAFSGGKDSVTLLALAKAAGVKFDAHYHLTTVDPPEVVQFIKTMPEVEIVRPPKSMWQLVTEPGQGLLPMSNKRWCCKLLKENGGHGRLLLTGLRWAESIRRSRRKLLEVSKADPSKKFCNAIIDWTDDDVWEYIHEQHVPYCRLYNEGFKRIGCILCPMVAVRPLEYERYPKIVQAWRNAANRVFNDRKDRGLTLHWATGDDYFNWWLSREGLGDSQQATFDDCLVPFSD
jgi:phosphoadenosine phosphosulfate reductase